MKHIYIWGIGNGITNVLKSICLKKAKILNLIDINKKKIGTIVEGIEVIHPDNIDKNVDYIIISAMIHFSEIKKELCIMGYEESKILCYYDINDHNFNVDIDFINHSYRILTLLDRKYEKEFFKNRNYEYEIADKIRKNEYIFPIIKSSEECLERVLKEKLSICRFGDGEFEMIFQRERPCFQSPNNSLSKRLREVLVNNHKNILTCIAKDYGSLEEYTEDSANDIRKYMSPLIRKQHMEVLDLKKEYYDAFISRPYIIYKNKENAVKIFNLWKEIWKNREVVIVEGEHTRNGVKNNLFDNAKKVKRILCPINNVWSSYEKIFSYIIKNIDKDALILITLGPTATVLAYDLAQSGYQAIDMGQLDNEYEWYLKQADIRINIAYKYVAECGIAGQMVEEIDDKVYLSQILIKIGCM